MSAYDKERLLRVRDYIKTSDEEAGFTISSLQEDLHRNGISADKTTLYRDFDTLRAYANAVSADVNNDSAWDETDTWGMVMYNKRDFPVYFENPFCQKDESGKPYISLFSERLADVYEKVYQFYQVEHGCHQFQIAVRRIIKLIGGLRRRLSWCFRGCLRWCRSLCRCTGRCLGWCFCGCLRRCRSLSGRLCRTVSGILASIL